MNAYKRVKVMGLEQSKEHTLVLAFIENYEELQSLQQAIADFENIEFHGGFDAVKQKIKDAKLNKFFCISTACEDGYADWYVSQAEQAIFRIEQALSEG